MATCDGEQIRPFQPRPLLSSSTALSAFQVPVVNVRPDFYSDLRLGGNSNVLTTAPDLGAQARVITDDTENL